MSPYYQQLAQMIIDRHQLASDRLLEFLLDCYQVDQPRHLRIMTRQITKRLYKGVDKQFLIHLRTLYALLGHFLKQIRYI